MKKIKKVVNLSNNSRQIQNRCNTHNKIIRNLELPVRTLMRTQLKKESTNQKPKKHITKLDQQIRLVISSLVILRNSSRKIKVLMATN
jgi:hypothetical protein